MARKLLMMAALISLVLLVQAPGSFAETYNYTYPSDSQITGNYENSTWKHGYSDMNPWDAGTELYLGGPTYYSTAEEAIFKVGFTNGSTTYLPYTNNNPGVQNPDGSYTIVFDSTLANPGFFFTLPDGTTISSTNTVITYNVQYTYTNRYTVTYGQFIGEGTNSSDQTPFRFEALLVDTMGNHQNVGYMTSFSLVYPYNGSPVPTPIPGAVWLLGTGLLGLACVRRRRRK